MPYQNPITHTWHNNLGYCCSGGGYPLGDFWIIEVPNRVKANQPNWSETELLEDEYATLRTLTNNDGYTKCSAYGRFTGKI